MIMNNKINSNINVINDKLMKKSNNNEKWK